MVYKVFGISVYIMSMSAMTDSCMYRLINGCSLNRVFYSGHNRQTVMLAQSQRTCEQHTINFSWPCTALPLSEQKSRAS